MARERGRLIALRGPAWMPAVAAALLGTVSAASSAYWGAGGTALLETIGGTLEHEGDAHDPTLMAALWGVAGLKLAAVAVGLAAVARPQRLSDHRRVVIRSAAWLAAIILGLYGGVLTLVGVLVQANILRASAHADRTALRWHAFLWDPWFLAWGLLAATALALSRPPISHVPKPAANTRFAGSAKR